MAFNYKFNFNLKSKFNYFFCNLKEANCDTFASDKELLDVSLKFVLMTDETNISTATTSTVTCLIPDEMRFDIQIMILGFVLNLFVNSFKKKSAQSLVNYKNKQMQNMSLLEIVLKAYLSKEALVHLAEDDHQNELDKINEQIESQNVENINAAIMNCKSQIFILKKKCKSIFKFYYIFCVLISHTQSGQTHGRSHHSGAYGSRNWLSSHQRQVLQLEPEAVQDRHDSRSTQRSFVPVHGTNYSQIYCFYEHNGKS